MISPGAWLIIQPGQKLQEALYASGGAAENRRRKASLLRWLGPLATKGALLQGSHLGSYPWSGSSETHSSAWRQST